MTQSKKTAPRRREISHEERSARAFDLAIARLVDAEQALRTASSAIGRSSIDHPISKEAAHQRIREIDDLAESTRHMRHSLVGWRNLADGYTEDGG